MLNPACFLVLLSSIFLYFVLSCFSFLCLRLAVRGAVTPTVCRGSAAGAGLPWAGLRSPVSVCRGGQDRSAVRLCLGCRGDLGAVAPSLSALRLCLSAVGRRLRPRCCVRLRLPVVRLGPVELLCCPRL